jgi:hypothetical protein
VCLFQKTGIYWQKRGVGKAGYLKGALLKLERQLHEAVTWESKCMGQSLVGLNGNGIRDSFQVVKTIANGVRWNDRSLPKECGATCSTVKRPARAMHALWRHDQGRRT